MNLISLIERLPLPTGLTALAALKTGGQCLVYAFMFVGLHHLAALWATGGIYSLWFPGAGLRFAFLWWAGPKITPVAALAEFAMQFTTGELRFADAPLADTLGVISPCLIYGLVIFLVQRSAGKRTPMLGLAPLPFALASVIGPISACLSALPWAIPAAHISGTISVKALISALAVFTLGDMLGVLIVAPPLLWFVARIQQGGGWADNLPSRLVLIEATFLTAIAWTFVWAMQWAGLGLWLAPVLLATCWIGLRAGRSGAWAAMLVAVLITLPITARMADENERLGLHMLLACISAVGYLAGSFAEAEARSHLEIARRDKLLYQAERLKTLRAMSIAVIHEISQPLSTIAIEAEHLAAAHEITPAGLADIRNTASLIARKSNDLSQMVRRLRRYGDRKADDVARIPVSLLIDDVRAIAKPEAEVANVRLRVSRAPNSIVTGQDVELRQLLLNLVRNAIAASPPNGSVDLRCAETKDGVHFLVENEENPARAAGPGMGVGLLIARSIAEAHNGSINQSRPAPGRFQSILTLPASKAEHA